MAKCNKQPGEDVSRKTSTSRLSRTTNPSAIAELLWREDPSTAQMKEIYEGLLHREHAYIKDGLEPFLSHNEMLELRKKEILHKKWSERVAEPIRRELDRQMHSRQLPALERRRKQLYDDYLTHVNRKGHVFLDVIAPDEYYALALQAIQPLLLKAKTQRLRDPTLAQHRSRMAEDRVELRCLSGSFLTDRDIQQIRLPPMPLVPLGRDGANARSWVRMPLGDIDGPERRASRHRMHGSGTRSAIDFGAWGRTPLSRVIVDEELKMQKKRHFPHPHAPRPQRLPRQPRPHPPTYETQVKVVQPEPATESSVTGPQPQPSVVAVQPQLSVIETQLQISSPAEPSTEKPQPQPPTLELQPQSSVVVPQPQPSVVKPEPQGTTVEPQPPQLSVVEPQLQGSIVKSRPPMRESGQQAPAQGPHPPVHEPRPHPLYPHEPPHTSTMTQGVIPPNTSIIIAC